MTVAIYRETHERCAAGPNWVSHAHRNSADRLGRFEVLAPSSLEAYTAWGGTEGAGCESMGGTSIDERRRERGEHRNVGDDRQKPKGLQTSP